MGELSAHGKSVCVVQTRQRDDPLLRQEGIFFNSDGKSWFLRNDNYKSFVDMQDMGNELIATIADGHTWVSSSGGFSWFLRR